MHDADPVVGLYVPLGQGLHADWPSPEYVPTGHNEHDDDLVVPANDPAAQGVQFVWPAVE